MPWTTAGLVIGGLSLIGVPGTVGFVSKWYLVLAALERGWTWLAVLSAGQFAVGAGLCLACRRLCYFREPSAQLAAVREAPLSMLIPAWLLVAACLYLRAGHRSDRRHRVTGG